MPLWNVVAPAYVPPSAVTPAWIWSIVGTGRNVQNSSDSIVIRLDYVKLDAAGNYVRVNNFRPGWSSGGCTMYIPLFMHLNEGTVGNAGGSFVGGYDYFASNGANYIWQNYIYKFLYGMRSVGSLVAYFPLP
jgi:hypothetical protein